MVKDFQSSVITQLMQEASHHKGLGFGYFEDGTVGVTLNA